MRGWQTGCRPRGQPRHHGSPAAAAQKQGDKPGGGGRQQRKGQPLTVGAITKYRRYQHSQQQCRLLPGPRTCACTYFAFCCVLLLTHQIAAIRHALLQEAPANTASQQASTTAATHLCVHASADQAALLLPLDVVVAGVGGEAPAGGEQEGRGRTRETQGEG